MVKLKLYLGVFFYQLIFSLNLIVVAVLGSSCTNNQPAITPRQTIEEEYIYHKIKYSGETVAIISAWYTKSSKNWPEIVDANPKMVPSRLRIGDIVRIPKRLVKRFSSLPKEFVSSYDSGVNKDTSKSEKTAVESAPDHNRLNDSSSEPEQTRESQNIQAEESSTIEEQTANDNSTIEANTANEPDESSLYSPDLQPEAIPETKKAEEVTPANDENSKIREQLMQELLQ